MKILVLPAIHIDCAFDGARGAALGAIESEIPTATALVALINPYITSKVYTEGSVGKVFRKFTILWEQSKFL